MLSQELSACLLQAVQGEPHRHIAVKVKDNLRKVNNYLWYTYFTKTDSFAASA
jgi:hypothetical protein